MSDPHKHEAEPESTNVRSVRARHKYSQRRTAEPIVIYNRQLQCQSLQQSEIEIGLARWYCLAGLVRSGGMGNPNLNTSRAGCENASLLSFLRVDVWPFFCGRNSSVPFRNGPSHFEPCVESAMHMASHRWNIGGAEVALPCLTAQLSMQTALVACKFSSKVEIPRGSQMCGTTWPVHIWQSFV